MSSGPERPPSFLFASTGLRRGSGGIAELSRQVLRVLRTLHEEGMIRLEVCVLDGSGPEPDDVIFGETQLSRMYWCGGKRWKFVLRLMRAQADYCLFDHVGLARSVAWLPSGLRGTYMLLIHSVEIWNNNRKDYYRAARRAHLLIANSGYTRRQALAHYPDLPKIVVCWPGKNGPEYLADPGSDSSGDFGPHAMLIVGRLSAAQRHKGHDQLLEALPRVLEIVPDARLVIAGGGDDRERLELKAHELNVAGRVVFTGWVDEARLHRLYSQCALFVMPSVGDGFGIVFLEALMHGMPCVGLQNSAAAEIIEDGRSGVLVDRDDLQGMADCLAQLLLDEPGRRRLGEAGLQRYRSVFQARQHAERFVAIMKEQLAS